MSERRWYWWDCTHHKVCFARAHYPIHFRPIQSEILYHWILLQLLFFVPKLPASCRTIQSPFIPLLGHFLPSLCGLIRAIKNAFICRYLLANIYMNMILCLFKGFISVSLFVRIADRVYCFVIVNLFEGNFNAPPESPNRRRTRFHQAINERCI